MPWCPFKDVECYSECEWFDHRIRRCQVVSRTLQLESLHKIAMVLLDRMTEESRTGIAPEAEEA